MRTKVGASFLRDSMAQLRDLMRCEEPGTPLKW